MSVLQPRSALFLSISLSPQICMTGDLREAEQKMQRDGLGFSRLSMLTYVVASLLVITTIVYCVYGTVDEVWEY